MSGRRLLSAALAATCLAAAPAFAGQRKTSASYEIQTDLVIGAGGGVDGRSAQYSLTGSVGQLAVATMTNTQRVESGYISADYSPALTGPDSGVYVSTVHPTLAWNVVLTGSHQVVLSNLSDFSAIVYSTITTASYARVATALSHNTTYWWKVRQLTDTGWSPARSFVVDVQGPALTSPQVSTGTAQVSWKNLPMTTYLSSTVVRARMMVQDPLSGLRASTGAPSGLLGLWHFDESSGTLTLDALGFHDLSFAGGSKRWTSGIRGAAVKFDGGAFSVPDDGLLDSTDPALSVSVWMRHAPDSFQRGLVEKYDTPANTGYLLRKEPNGTLSFACASAGLFTAVTAERYDDDRWHHVAGTCAFGEVRLFVDGVERAKTIGPAGSLDNISPLGIGTGPNNWLGELDELRVYDRSLSTGEVLAAYQQDSLAAYVSTEAYHVLYSTDGGKAWRFVDPASVTLTGAFNGDTSARMMEATLSLVTSTAPLADTNRVAFVVSDFAGGVSTAAYTVLVDTVGSLSCESFATKDAANGNWSDRASWDYGIVPTACNQAYIRAGSTVTVDITTATVSTTTIFGNLLFSRTQHSTLTVVQGDITVKAGGHLDLGTEASPIPAGTSAQLVLAYGRDQIRYGLIVEDGGDFTVRGATITPDAVATGDIVPGLADTVDFAFQPDTTLGWKVGDRVTIGPTQGTGPTQVEERTIASFGPNNFTVDGGSIFSLYHYSTGTIRVANLARNVVIRSSGTGTATTTAYIKNLAGNATSFSVAYGEFAYIGLSSPADKSGIVFAAGAQGSISSSTIREGQNGLNLTGGAGQTLYRNLIYKNAGQGLDMQSGSAQGRQFSVLDHYYANGGEGVLVTPGGASDLSFIESKSYANAGIGLSLQNLTGGLVSKSEAYSNGGRGIHLSGAQSWLLDRNLVHHNGTKGIDLELSAHENLLYANRVHDNAFQGIHVQTSRNLLAENVISTNGVMGVYFQGGAAGTNVLLKNAFYGNLSAQLRLLAHEQLLSAGDGYGFDEFGRPVGGGGSIFYFDGGAGVESLLLRGARDNQALPFDTAGLNVPGSWIVAYNENYTTGTVHVLGDRTLYGETWTLDYGLEVLPSTATRVYLLRGTGHSISLLAPAAAAVDQVITVRAVSGTSWEVRGSSSGLLLSQSCSPSSNCGFLTGQVNFTLNTGPGITSGDELRFGLIAGTGDTGRQKTLLFDFSDPALHAGRAKLTVAPGAGLVLQGKADGTANTLVDLGPGGTYYHLVSSGVFSARLSSFTRMAPDGLWFGGGSVSLSTAVFDRIANVSADNAYIHLQDLSGNATFYGLVFGTGVLVNATTVYNVRAAGDTSGLSWTLRSLASSAGALWGEDYDSDSAGRVNFYDSRCDPHQSVGSGPWSAPGTWTPPSAPAGCTQVTVAAGHTVELDISSASAGGTNIFGSLKFSRVAHSSLTLVGGDITVKSGGQLDIGTPASPIPLGTTAALVLAYGQTAGQYGLIIEDGGDFTVVGATKSPYAFASQSISAVDFNLSVAQSSATNWSVGDEITIGPSTALSYGPGTTARKTITSLGIADPVVVGFGSALGTARVLSSTGPILIANLTRNAVVRSSGTDTAANTAYIRSLVSNATSFTAHYAEFAYLGAAIAGKTGLTFDAAAARGSVSSSTVRDGYRGVEGTLASGLVLDRSLIYKSADIGLSLLGSPVLGNGGNTVTETHVYGSGSYGLYMESSSSNSVRGSFVYSNNASGGYLLNGSTGNWIERTRFFHNNSAGLYIQGSSGNDLAAVDTYRNVTNGLQLDQAPRNAFDASRSYDNNLSGIYLDKSYGNYFEAQQSDRNGDQGFKLLDSGSNTFVGAAASNNVKKGFELVSNSHGNTLARMYVGDNTQEGLMFANSSSNTVVGGFVYGNSTGVLLTNSFGTLLADLWLGREPGGAVRNNSKGGFSLGDIGTANAVAVGGRFEDGPVGGTFNGPGKHVLGYAIDYDSGTVVLVGDYTHSGSVFRLEKTPRLRSSTHTAVVATQGAHSLSSIVTKDATTVTQGIVVRNTGGSSWIVAGTAAGGVIGPLTCSAGSSCGFTSGQLDFTLNTGLSVATSDQLALGIIAATPDDGKRKRLSIEGDAISGYNSGRGKFTIAPGAGISLIGVDGEPTIVDKELGGGGTYYSFVSSGSFFASFSSFTNMDSGGIQLSGNQGVSISSSVFDYMGFVKATNAYITVRDLVSQLTLNHVAFDLSRSSAGTTLYNVRVEGDASQLYWLFESARGVSWGENYDDDASGKIGWRGCGPIASAGTAVWSSPSAWSGSFYPSACNAATILAGHRVTVDMTTATASALTINGGGILDFSAVKDSSLTLTAGDLTVNSGGKLELGTAASPIPNGVRAHLVLSQPSGGARALIVNDGGVFVAYGAAKTPFTTGTAYINGTGNTVDLADDPTAMGWKLGDTVTIGATQRGSLGGTVEKVITALGVNQITVSPAFTTHHYSTGPTFVANLTRNVLIRSSGTGNTGGNQDAAYLRNLTTVATGFDLSYAELAELGTTGLGQNGVRLDTRGRISSCTIRDGAYGVLLAAVNGSTLTHNLVYRNDLDGLVTEGAQNARVTGNHFYANAMRGARILLVSKQLTFRENQAYSNASDGLYLGDRSSQIELSSGGFFANGGRGVQIVDSSTNSFLYNAVHNNLEGGVLLLRSSSNVFVGGSVLHNSSDGARVAQLSLRNEFLMVELSSNAGRGLRIADSDENLARGGKAVENALDGVLIERSRRALVEELLSLGNAGHGFSVLDSTGVSIIGAGSFGNLGDGARLDGGREHWLAGSQFGFNAGTGLLVLRGAESFAAGSYSFGNQSPGLTLKNTDRFSFQGGALGFRTDGSAAANQGYQAGLDPAASGSNFIELQQVRVSTQGGSGGVIGISTAGLNAPDKLIASWNQDYDTGTLRLWGDVKIDNDPIAIDYATRLLTSTNSSVRLVRGLGHSAGVCATYDSLAVSQLISIKREGGAWRVAGSSTGYLGALGVGGSCAGGFSSFGQFDLYLNEGPQVNEGDRLEFLLTGATSDAGVQKRVLAGTPAPAFNGGKTKIHVAAGVAFSLLGDPAGAKPTIMDRLSGNDTYYAFVASGPFTARYAEIRNADSRGIELTGAGPVDIATTSFDLMGIAGSANAYITPRDLLGNATFYGLSFLNSRSTAAAPAAFNIRMQGAVQPTWTIRRWSGPMGGLAYESDAFGTLSWAPFGVIPISPLATSISSWAVTVQWNPNGNEPQTRYRVEASTAANFSGPFVSSVTANAAATLSPLWANTTYYIQVSAVDRDTAPAVVLGATITRQAPPTEVLFEFISSTMIVVAAYAPTPDFRNLQEGRSATAIELDGGGFTNWRGSTWTPRAPMLGGTRFGLGGGHSLAGMVYAIGGGAGAAHLIRNEMYDPGANLWVSTASMPTLRRHPAVVTAPDGRIYALGGFNGAFPAANEVYDPVLQAWAAKTSMPTARDRAAAGYALGKLFVVGGRAGGPLSALNQAYDPVTDAWASPDKAPIPTARSGAAAGVFDDRLLVFGGDNLSGTYYDKTESYNPATDLWNPALAAMPTARSHAAAFVTGGKAYVIGGYDGVQRLAVNEEYDPRADTWTARVPMPTARSDSGAGRANLGFAIMGGITPGGETAAVETFDPGIAHAFTGLQPNSFHTFVAKARSADGIETGMSPSISTYTHAAVPSTATPTFVSVERSSVVFQWTSNGNSEGATPYKAEVSSAADFSGTLFFAGFFTPPGVLVSTRVEGLASNTTYYFRAKARNFYSVETEYRLLGSTPTAAVEPASAVSTFSSVFRTSMTVSWSANGNALAITTYTVILSTEAPLTLTHDGNKSVSTIPAGGLPTATLGGLDGNTTYYLFVRAINHAGVGTAFAALGSTPSLPFEPATVASTFIGVEQSSMTVAWDRNGNGAGTTQYRVLLTTGAPPNAFAGNVEFSTRPAGGSPAATASTLRSNATYFLHVAAISHSGALTSFTALGSTVTRPAPSAQALESYPGVFATSMTAQWAHGTNLEGTRYEAKLSSAGFPGSLTVDSSTESFALSPSVSFTPLMPNTTYAMLVRTVARDGTSVQFLIYPATATRAAEPAAAGSSFLQVSSEAASVSWSVNGNPVARTSYTVTLSTASPLVPTHTGNVTVSTIAATEPAAATLPVLPNTTYFLFVRARNHAGLETGFSALGSTITRAAAPATAVTTFTAVHASSMSAAWLANGNPAGSTYTVVLTTETPLTLSHIGTVVLTTAPAGSPLAGTLGPALVPATTYYLFVRAVGHDLTPTAFVALGSSVTLPAVPAQGAPAFTSVEGASITFSWGSGGNAGGTEYEAQKSLASDFSGAISSFTRNSAVPWGTGGEGPALGANTTHYFRARARSPAGIWSGFGTIDSTATLAAVPATSIFTDVSSSAMSGNFGPNGNPFGITTYTVVLTTRSAPLGLPGDVSFSTAPSGFTASFGGLAPNTTYQFFVRAVNHNGIPSAYAVGPATSTLAAAPASAVSTFTGVTQTTISVAWAADGNPLSVTTYTVVLSTETPLVLTHAGNIALSTRPAGAAPAATAGLPATAALSPNTTYYLFVKAVNHNGLETAFTALGATATFPNPPATAVSTFPAVTLSTITASWEHNGNPAGTRYSVVLTTDTAFPNSHAGTLLLSTAPAGVPPSATLTGLAGNATYYLKVAPVSRTGAVGAYVSLGSTWTPVDTPAVIATTLSDVSSGSLVALWGPATNVPGTRYELTTVPASVTVSTRPEGAPAAGTTGLTPNTAYTAFVKAFGRDGAQTGGVNIGSTVTLAAAPGGALIPFPAASSMTLTVEWGASGNPASTQYDAVLTTASPLLLTHTGNVSITTAPTLTPTTVFANLAVNTTYYLFARAVDQVARPTAYAALGTSATLAGAPVLPSAVTSFMRVDFNALTYRWEPAGNPAGTLYRADLATVSDFSAIDRSSFTRSTSAVFGAGGLGAALPADATYYLRVQAINHSGVATAFTTVESTRTLPSDIVRPSIDDKQGGDNAWRRLGTASYDVDFHDTGGSKLAKFSVKGSSRPAAQTALPLIDYTDTVTGLTSDDFTADWSLPPAVFTALQDETTNWISVKAFDGLSNSSEAVDAFFVLKDTTPPRVTGAILGAASFEPAAGTLYDVDAVDPGSGLVKFQYSASGNSGVADEAVLPWTDIAVLVPGTTHYATNWSVAASSWNALAEGVTNYISLRAWDLAGTTKTLAGAFTILKDTSGPTVAITVPASSHRSALTTISGTAADLLGVKGTELNIRRTPGANYWNGLDFTAPSPQWFTATGSTTWTLTPGIGWVDGESYELVARSSDAAGNFSTTWSTASFTFDNSTPTVGIVVPAPPGGTLASLPLITGTAADPDPGNGSQAGLASIELRLQRRSDNLYWNFVTESWGSTPVSQVPSGANPWSHATSQKLRANLAHGTSYWIEARASDNAAPANAGDFDLKKISFTFSDTTPPAAISQLTALYGAASGDIDLTWTAPGDDGADGMILTGQFRIQHSTDAAITFSSASAQVVISTSLVVPGSSHTATLAGLTPGGTYYLRAWTSDDAGNWSPISAGATAYARPAPFEKITGRVLKVSSEGITAVLVECLGDSGQLWSSAFTLADGSGTYQLDNVPAGNWKVQATWEASGIKSSVWLDGVAMGSTGIDFVLNLTYTLSTVQGSLQNLAAGSAAQQGFMSVAAVAAFAGSRVELYRGGAQVAAVGVDPAGRWRIGGLLPGKYGVRAYNGFERTDLQEFELLEGEVKDINFVFDPLPERSVFAFPNPAREQATIRFVSALAPLEAQVRIFDIAGRLVREIPGSALSSPSPALYHAVWDLRNDDGEDVASGVYLFIVKVKGGNGQSARATKKLAVTR